MKVKVMGLLGCGDCMVVLTRQPRDAWRLGWLLCRSADDREGMA